MVFVLVVEFFVIFRVFHFLILPLRVAFVLLLCKYRTFISIVVLFFQFFSIKNKNIMQVTDKDDLRRLIKELKSAGLIYNEADLCQKSGVPQSYLSDMKAGRRPISEEMLQRIERAFPSFFSGDGTMERRQEPTLGDLARMIADHDMRFHDQMERLMDAMGVGKKDAV